MIAAVDTGHQNAHCVTVSYDSCESLKSTVSSRGNGTMVAAPSNYGQNRNRKRVSILKKLREKLSTNDPSSSTTASSLSAYVTDPVLYHQDGQPTVIRIGGGTVSSCTSTVRSWRVVDDFLRNRFDFSSPSRQSTISSNRSLSSGKTFIYDDKSLEINKPDFCTVINVEDGQNGMDADVFHTFPQTTPTPTPLSLDNVNVIIEQHDSNSSLSSSPSSLCAAALQVCATPNVECEPGDHSTSNKPEHPINVERATEPSCANIQSSTNEEPSPTVNNSRNVVCTVPSLPSIILPSPMAPLQIFPQPRTGASGSSPIELTNWRVRADFDADPGGSRPSAETNQRSDHSSTNAFTNLNLLTPDDLPRLYPGWNVPMPPPFRFDEEFEEEPKGLLSDKYSHSLCSNQ